MTAPRRPVEPPPSPGVLAKYVEAHTRQIRVSVGRLRAWIAYMMMAGLLERAAGERLTPVKALLKRLLAG